jgi:hypothetical protein
LNYLKQLPIAVLAFVAALLLLQCGCSVVGSGIGAAIDSRKPKRVSVSGWQLTKIKRDTKIWATLDDSVKVTGKFAGVIPLDHNQFVDLYTSFRGLDSVHSLLPAIGDTLLILPKKSHWLRARLLDVSSQDNNSKWGFRFATEQLDSGKLHDYRLNQITALRTIAGGIIPGPQLSTLILDSNGIVPFTAIEIVNDSGNLRFPIENVARLTVPNHRHGRTIGLLIGAALDAAAIAIVIALSSMEMGFGGN